jgi:hypothetical protein
MSKKLNKSKAVRNYLAENGSIDTWTAITLFRATRLSSIIFNARKHGWVIDSVKPDKEMYCIYKLIAKPATWTPDTVYGGDM